MRGWGAPAGLRELASAVGLAAVFVVSERRSVHPFVPTALARSVPVTAATVLLPVVMVGLFGSLFTATFHLQDTLRPDPLTTGLRVLPLTVLRVIGSPPAGAALGGWGRARPRSPAPCSSSWARSAPCSSWLGSRP
ncbi:hypothetical protein ACFWFS_02290 [Streptomyces albidoflavus]